MLQDDDNFMRACRLASQLPAESRFKMSIAPEGWWDYSKQMLSVIEYDLRVLNHTVAFLLAGKNSKSDRDKYFPKERIEPDFVKKMMPELDKEKETPKRSYGQSMPIEELEAILNSTSYVTVGKKVSSSVDDLVESKPKEE